VTHFLTNGPVTLTPLTEADRGFFTKLANIPDIHHRINKPLPYTAEHFDGLLAQIQENERCFYWVISHSGRPCGIINSADWRKAGVYQGGYWIAPDQRGRGIAALALDPVRDFLFAEASAERIQALVEPDNSASIRVLEKCGYVREGLLRKFFPQPSRGLIDVYMYACFADGSNKPVAGGASLR
jgi:RimJ/RimL family protein N-acetyltransferase